MKCTKGDGEDMMRFLVVQPLHCTHAAFDIAFIRALASIGSVTYAGVSELPLVDEAIQQLPIGRGAPKRPTRLRWLACDLAALRDLRALRMAGHYDKTFLLAYDTLALFIGWPRSWPVIVVDHNNVENAVRKTWAWRAYKWLPNGVLHLVFMEHTAAMIRRCVGRRALVIPHPGQRCAVGNGSNGAPVGLEGSSCMRVFSPSGGTPAAVQQALVECAAASNGGLLVRVKGPVAAKGDSWEMRPFFDDYEECIDWADYVFWGGEYVHRVSGVVFEALSRGTRVILTRSPFALWLRAKYPRLIWLVDCVGDIVRGDEAPDEGRASCFIRFGDETSQESLGAALTGAMLEP